jgi:hypothetical protein
MKRKLPSARRAELFTLREFLQRNRITRYMFYALLRAGKIAKPDKIRSEIFISREYERRFYRNRDFS